MRIALLKAPSFGLVLSLLLCVTAIASAEEILDPGAPWPKYRVEELIVPDSVEDGELTVLELVDLDGDHLLDLLVAWRVGDAGVLVAYQGGSREWRIEHDTPLMEPVILARTPSAIAHATVADMDWDGYLDVVMAVEGRMELEWFSLSSPLPVEVFEVLPLPGSVTSLTALDYGRRDFVVSPVVGVVTAAGPELALFPEWKAPVAQAPLFVPIGGAAHEIATGDLDGDAWWDLVVATDRGIEVLAGTDSGSRTRAREMAVSKSLIVGDSAVAFALDRFGRSTTHRLVFAGSEGILLSDPKTASLSSSLKNTASGGASDWVRSMWSGVGRGPALALPDPKGVRLYGALDLDGEGVWQAAESAILDLGGHAVIAEAGRISRDAVDDLVVLLEGESQPTLLIAAPRTTYGVTTEDDHDDGNCDGDCTLREAINAANAAAGYDVILMVPGGPAPHFYPTIQLPDLTDSVGLNMGSLAAWFLDGSECSGGCTGLVLAADTCGVDFVHASNFAKNVADQRGVGYLLFGSYHSWLDAVSATHNESHGVVFYDSSDTHLVGEFSYNDEDGVHLKQGVAGLTDNNHISSIIVNNNGGSGVRIDNVPETMVGGSGASNRVAADGNQFAGINISGPATSGTTIGKLRPSLMVPGNGFHSVYIAAAGSITVGSPISGAESDLRNNPGTGVTIWNSSADIQIVNCSMKDNGQYGIGVFGSSNVTIGPDVQVVENAKHGVFITDDGVNPSHHITIEDSVIGSTQALPLIPGNSWFGIEIAGGHHNTIGSPGHGNTITRNGWGGIRILGEVATGNSIRGNFIGTDPNGANHGNDGAGVVIESAPSNSIGGAVDGGNVIAWNEGHGIVVGGKASVHVDLRFNSIHDNDGIGIDLGGDGVTLPDTDDVDSGPNGLLNQPLIAWAESCGGATYIVGQRHSGAGIFVHDLLTNTSCDPTGWGEGESHIGWFSTSNGSAGRYNFRTVVAGDYTGIGITGMTTDLGGSTSEFSNCKVVSAGRAGDATADCVFAADDVSGVIRVVDDPAHVTPGNPDADGNGVVNAADLPILLGKTFF